MINKKWIINYDELATNDLRRRALTIMEAGLSAIDTQLVIKGLIKFDGNILTIADKKFNLSDFRSVKVIGFGKASCRAAQALEEVLGDKISDGIVIDIHDFSCERIKT